MKPKPNPDTQAAVDAADLAGIAKAKADAAELTLDRWHTMLTTAGVADTRFEVRTDGIKITLRGIVGRRSVAVDVLAPKGQPFPLYCMIALHDFEQGTDKRSPEFVESATTPGVEVARVADMSRPDFMPAADKIVARPTKCAHDPADVPSKPAEELAARAADIAKRSSPIDIAKPPPAGAGKRRPLSLPLCKQCNAQPVYQPHAEFCGAECSKAWHMNHAARTAKGSKR
jgi:hypothetical protein